MNEFKLIAIRTGKDLKGLNSEDKEYGKPLFKVIKEFTLYQFYHEYKFITNGTEENWEVSEISYNQIIPDDLYALKTGKKQPIHISAIVGKNGSGKSTLLELIYATIFNLSFEAGILTEFYNETLEKLTPLRKILNLNVELFYLMDGAIFSLKVNSGMESTFRITKFKEVDNSRERQFKLNELIFKENDNKNLLKQHIKSIFFFTISINYSLYSLNSKNIGEWIIGLFHKNDAYQTPLVINPYRVEGNLDINIEDDLVHQRLIANILELKGEGVSEESSLRNFAPNKIAKSLWLTFNSDKFEKIKKEINENKITNGKEYFKELFEAYSGESLEKYLSKSTYSYVENYVVFKLFKICTNYKPYKDYKIWNNNIVSIDLIDKVCDDNSHITFKLKQAINFLRTMHFQNLNLEGKSFEVDIEELSQNIELAKNNFPNENRKPETIEFIPPSFFDSQIHFFENGKFDDFSSGEKQKIHGIYSVIYHLQNLNSVFKNNNKELIQYSFVNLIFDEVELYFHPDLQRTYINDLINYIERINPINIENIKGINICFSTHSPFILSDIPSLNILKLIDGGPLPFDINEKTFGSNIHKLLAKDFFMADRFMGELAYNFIVSLIEEINKIDKIKKLDADQIFKKINLVGEPFFEIKLREMLYKKLDESEDDLILFKIEEKKMEIDLLNKKLNNKTE